MAIYDKFRLCGQTSARNNRISIDSGAKTNSCGTLRVFSITSMVIVFMTFFSFCPSGLAAAPAESEHDMSRRAEKAYPEESAEIGSFKRFEVDLFGGFSTVSAADLNLLADHDDRIQEFSYDTYFESLQGAGKVRSWTKTQEGVRGRIRNAFPLGLRLRYRVSDMMAVSIGLKYILGRRSSDIESMYVRNKAEGDRQTETLTYSPYTISAKAFIPTLGIHLMKKSKALTFEGYLTAGPAFAECRHLTDWGYQWRIEGSDYNFIPFESEGLLEETGKGTGIALDAGARVQHPLINSLAVFLEGGYAYQVVKKISGPGREVREGSNQTWNGQWAVVKENVASPWGALETEYPTAGKPEGASLEKIRDFKLDLSEFQVRLGLALRF